MQKKTASEKVHLHISKAPESHVQNKVACAWNKISIERLS